MWSFLGVRAEGVSWCLTLVAMTVPLEEGSVSSIQNSEITSLLEMQDSLRQLTLLVQTSSSKTHSFVKINAKLDALSCLSTILWLIYKFFKIKERVIPTRRSFIQFSWYLKIQRLLLQTSQLPETKSDCLLFWTAVSLSWSPIWMETPLVPWTQTSLVQLEAVSCSPMPRELIFQIQYLWTILDGMEVQFMLLILSSISITASSERTMHTSVMEVQSMQ